jgi:hypothetical protein
MNSSHIRQVGKYFPPSTPPDLLDSQELLRVPAFPLNVPKFSPALDRASVYSHHNAIN